MATSWPRTVEPPSCRLCPEARALPAATNGSLAAASLASVSRSSRVKDSDSHENMPCTHSPSGVEKDIAQRVELQQLLQREDVAFVAPQALKPPSRLATDTTGVASLGDAAPFQVRVHPRPYLLYSRPDVAACSEHLSQGQAARHWSGRRCDGLNQGERRRRREEVHGEHRVFERHGRVELDELPCRASPEHVRLRVSAIRRG